MVMSRRAKSDKRHLRHECALETVEAYVCLNNACAGPPEKNLDRFY